jgi:hypothetical protein
MSTQIVHNTGTNFTLYYNTLNYFKTIMKNHPSIGAVTQGDITKLDVDQFPAYPLGNVNITDTSFGTSITTYQIQLTVADKIKNKNNESNPTTNAQTLPFYGVDDVVDIHANTLAIINDLTSYTQRGVAGFEINGDINCAAFDDSYNNGLAGWVATFELTTHNDKNRCLFFLISPSGSGFVIQDCITGDNYKAALNGSGSIGQIFSAPYVYPNANQQQPITTSYGVNCYTIVERFENSDDFDLVNLPILQIPTASFEDCEECLAFIAPQVWGTSVNTWNLQPDSAYRIWRKA